MDSKLTDTEKVFQATKKYLKENAALLKKYHLQSRVVVRFTKKKPGIVVKLALWILKRNGAKADTEFSVKQK